MLLTNAAISRRSTVFFLMLVIFLVGLFSYVTLPRESNPDITIPMILVQTTYEGAASEDVENLITIPLERKLKSLKNIKEISSVSAEGASMVTVEYMPDVDIDDALQKVRDKVDQAKGELPGDLEDDPVIFEINLSEFPIMKVAISADLGERVLKQIAEKFEDRFEEIPGVLEVDVTGVREREIRVEFDPDRMAAYKLSFTEILSLVQRENVNVPGGSIDLGRGKYMLRVPWEFTDPSGIDNLVLVARDGRPIYLKDVATIRDTFEDARDHSRMNGHSSVTLSIKKRTGENIIEVSDQVFAILGAAEPLLPHGVEYTVTLNESKDIKRMVSELENNILTALVLVLTTLFLFLGVRSSLLVALAIPFSFFISFIILQAMGITLNMVVLFSLILALGMLVDNAIVMVENIYRHLEEGKDRVEAARIAAKEVGWPIIASTVTTLCAFGPMLFWPDIMGEFMSYLPKTLIIVLSASLFVALVINPVVASATLKAGGRRSRKDKDHTLLIQAYRVVLRYALNHRALVVFIAIFMLIGTMAAYFGSGPEVELFPETDPNRSYIQIEAPQGTNLETTNGLALEVESIINSEEDLKYVTGEVGVASDFGGGEARKATVSVEFVERDERQESSAVVADRMREMLGQITGADIKVEKERMGPPVGAPVEIEFIGADVEVLSGLVENAKALIADVPGLVDVKDDLSRAKPEIAFHVDREKATLMGLSTIEISNTIKAAVNGWRIGDYREGEDEYGIIARLPEKNRQSINQIESLLIPTHQPDREPPHPHGEGGSSSLVVCGHTGNALRVRLHKAPRPEASHPHLGQHGRKKFHRGPQGCPGSAGPDGTSRGLHHRLRRGPGGAAEIVGVPEQGFRHCDIPHFPGAAHPIQLPGPVHDRHLLGGLVSHGSVPGSNDHRDALRDHHDRHRRDLPGRGSGEQRHRSHRLHQPPSRGGGPGAFRRINDRGHSPFPAGYAYRHHHDPGPDSHGRRHQLRFQVPHSPGRW
jgi:multidrug efflux pump subunit AcrB